MTERAASRSHPGIKRVFAAVVLIATMPLLTQTTPAQTTPAQPAPPDQPPAARRPIAPAWGGMAFETAAVKLNTSGSQHWESNFPIGPYDWYSPTGGVLSAKNFPLISYILFAYRVFPNDRVSLLPQLPAWTHTTRYDIQAQAPDRTATKDQMRLMMQSLLADRFNLKIHTETRTVPVYALVLTTPGHTGPQLQLHPPGDAKCSTKPSSKTIGIFPAACGAVGEMTPSNHGNLRFGARNVDFSRIATALPALGAGLDRQVLDQTGLSGRYDFNLEWTPAPTPELASAGPTAANPSAATQPAPDPASQADPNLAAFTRALDSQLGLKLIPQQAPMPVFVLDHIERPPDN